MLGRPKEYSSHCGINRELKMNTGSVKKKLIAFIRCQTKRAGVKRIVIGLSGGVDSTVSVYLAKAALGPKNVLGLMMPYKTSSPSDIKDARLVVKALGIRSKTLPITSMVDAYFRKFPKANRVRRGNKMARERMSILYDQSKTFKAIVMGTGNKTEILLGYYTLHGDAACSINVIGSLYKTQVWQLAKALGVPKSIITKAPSAGLWPGQTDEGELGMTYREADCLLYHMIDKEYSSSRLARMGFKKSFIRKVSNRIDSTCFKRLPPQIAQI